MKLYASLPARLECTDAAPDSTGPVEVTGLAVPWNQRERMNGFGDTVEFAPGSLTVEDPGRVKFAGDHRVGRFDAGGPLVFGYGVAFDDQPDGLHGTFAVPRDELADPEVARVVRQMGNGVRDALSVGVEILEADESRDDERNPFAPVHYRVTAGRLFEVSSVVLPMFDDARHPRIAASADTDTDGTARFRLTAADPDPVDEPADDPPAEPLEETPMPETDTVDRVAAHSQVVAAITPVTLPSPHPLASFASFGHYALARFNDPTVPTLQAALADQVPATNPGVMPPSWLGEVRGIVDLGRPFISALGGPASAGDSGMRIDWPYFAGDLYALVAPQTAPKAPITSVKVDLLDGSAALVTYAGGSDIALQLIERSQPSYLDAYLRIMSAAYSAVTDRAAIDAAAAAATGGVLLDVATADADAVAAALFEASVLVQRATGLPASVVAVSSDIFPKVAAAIMSVNSGSDNTAHASANAGTLSVSLAGLSIVHVPGAAAGTMLVTNGQAVRWVEDGPRTIDAFAVEKLGRDVAVYGYGTTAPFIPAGIVEVSATPPITTTASSKSK